MPPGSDRRPVIFIGAPCFDMVAPEILEDWMRFAFHCGRRMPQYDFFVGIRTKAEQFRARNGIVEAAQKIGADYLLMLDDDMVINHFVEVGVSDSYVFLERLITHNKDIVGALYYQRTGACAPVAMMQVPGANGYRFLRDNEITGGLQKVDIVGGGCMLIKMRVFDRIPMPYFGPEFEFGTDIQLCRAAVAKGFDIWLDSGIELGHLRNERVIVTSRNRHQQLDATLPGEIKRQFVGADVFNLLIEDAYEYTGWGIEEMTRNAHHFMLLRDEYRHLGDSEWYQLFGKERVARQVWFNTQVHHKRQMTEYIIGSINPGKPLDVLDFGCGIGIPSFVLASRGHHVTALDIGGTGTLEFLKWRSKKHDVQLTIHESRGSIPALGGTKYDIIIAMDCLEHIERWNIALFELVRHLKPGGMLFANNAILDDTTHPEHYDLKPKDFVAACVSQGLMPLNQITYVKPNEEDHASNPNSGPNAVLSSAQGRDPS